MGRAIATMKIMPEGPGIDLNAIRDQALVKVKEYAGDVETKVVEEPIGFGIVALKITFVMDENLGSPDALEEHITSIEGVNSFEIIDVRRAMG